MTLEVVSVVLQGVVAFMFGGSLLVARRNLIAFRHHHQSNLLKSVMADYRELVAEGVFDEYQRDLDSWRTELLDSEPLAPKMAYYTRFDRISRIGFFYDHVGLLVRQGLLDFKLCFEVVPMPYAFWKDTREFRAVMKRATYAQFWDPFEYLHDRYERERSVRGRPATLRSMLGRRAVLSVSAESANMSTPEASTAERLG